jgi:hypothetical protein
MSPAGFELTIPASERPQTHALDRAATGIGKFRQIPNLNIIYIYLLYTLSDFNILYLHNLIVMHVTLFHLMSSLRMSGAIPLFPLYAFMAWTRKTLPILVTCYLQCNN